MYNVDFYCTAMVAVCQVSRRNLIQVIENKKFSGDKLT